MKDPRQTDTDRSAGDIESIEHKLSSTRGGESEVEQIAERIERRRAGRIPITFSSRVRFLKDCRKIAKGQGYTAHRISLDDLRAYRGRVQVEVDDNKGFMNNSICASLGLMTDVESLSRILDRSMSIMTESDIDSNWFYYADFQFDNTRIVSRWPFLRTELRTAALVIFLYYFFTSILFCNIMQESEICEPTGSFGSGWSSALYFASTTLSTVGYGDLSVSQDPRWRSFIGSAYMLLSMVVAVVAFSAAAGTAVSPLESGFDKLFSRFREKGGREDRFLYKRIRKVKFVKITELTVQILTYVLLGVFASQIAVLLDDAEDAAQWTWMTSFYWAIQTTTTIGYGDLTQPYGLRWFQIFYLMLATYVVGNSLGKLGSLKEELSKVRREHAWDRRRVTKRFVDELQAYEHDDKVDQYEFVVASLLSLGKLTSEDIAPIMDKFRDLAGDKGFISVDDDIEEESPEDCCDSFEEDAIDVEEE